MTDGNGFTNKEILIRLEEKVDDIRDDIKDTLHDHEMRLRTTERTASRGLGIVAALSFIMPVLATASWHIWG